MCTLTLSVRMSELSCYEVGILVQMDTRALISDLSTRETQRGAETEDRGWRIENIRRRIEDGRSRIAKRGSILSHRFDHEA
jgi:hypothetical protein